MSPPRKRAGGPEQHPETAAASKIAATKKQPDRLQDSGPRYRGASAPIKVAEVVAQDQRRKYAATIVRECGCGASHLHRGLGRRVAPCGRRYTLVAAAADERRAA